MSAIPWSYTVDGDDLVVRNITATCFGGMFDSGDNGETESGVPNNGFPVAGGNPNMALLFAPGFDPKKIADEWSESGFSYRIVGGAKFIS